VILDVGHPDILDFIDSKKLEEKKAWALIEQGYDSSFTGEAYGSVSFQNANHSVRVTDDFMRAVETDADWTTHAVVGGAPMGTHKARAIFRRMADAAHLCGDPGIQYDTTINAWNPASVSDRQYATNPCSEFSFQLQPGVAEPHKVRRRGRRARRRRLPLRLPPDDHGPGDPRRQRELPDAEDRGEQPPLPAAGPGLREPGRAPHEPRPGLRLSGRPGVRRRDHLGHDRGGVPPECRRRPRPRRPVHRVREESPRS